MFLVIFLILVFFKLERIYIFKYFKKLMFRVVLNISKYFNLIYQNKIFKNIFIHNKINYNYFIFSGLKRIPYIRYFVIQYLVFLLRFTNNNNRFGVYSFFQYKYLTFKVKYFLFIYLNFYSNLLLT